MNHKVTLTVLSIFSVFSCPEINRNQTSVKKLEFLSFSPVWADVNKYMRVTGTEVFLLLLLLGNHQCTEKDEIFVLIFTHHLYNIQLAKHSSLIFSLFHDSVESL